MALGLPGCPTGLLPGGLRRIGSVGLPGQLLLGVQLGLSHLLNDDPADLHILQVVVLHDLLVDALAELGADDPAALGRDRREVPAVLREDALEHRVVGDEVAPELDEILLVKLQGPVQLLDGVADAVIALQKIPQPVAGAVMGILEHDIRALDGTAHPGAARHQRAEGAGTQGHDPAAHPVDAHEDLHILAVVFRKALAVFDLHLQLVLDGLIGVVDGALHGEGVHGLVAGGPEDEIRALVDEGHQPLDQVVDKAVFIEVVAVLIGDVEDPRGLHLTVFRRSDELGVLAQVAHALGGDLLGQGHRHHLLGGGDKAPGVGDDLVDGVQAVLDLGEPCLVHRLVEHLILLLQHRLPGLGHGKEVLEAAVLLHRGADLIDIF